MNRKAQVADRLQSSMSHGATPCWCIQGQLGQKNWGSTGSPSDETENKNCDTWITCTCCYLYVEKTWKKALEKHQVYSPCLYTAWLFCNSCSLRMVHSFSTFCISISIQNSQCLTCCLFKENYIFSTFSHLASSPIYLELSQSDKCHAPDGMIRTFLFHSYVLSKVYRMQSRLWNTWCL